MRIEEETIGYASAEKVPDTIRDFLASRQNAAAESPRPSPLAPRPAAGAAELKVCLDSCCLAKGTDRVFRALQRNLAQCGANAIVKQVGCVGACYRTPMVEIAIPGKPSLTYTGLTLAEAGGLVQTHFQPRGLVRRVSQLWTRMMDSLLVEEDVSAAQNTPLAANGADAGHKVFFERQIHIAMENYGRLNPLSLDEYLAHDGFAALGRCLGSPKSKAQTLRRVRPV